VPFLMLGLDLPPPPLFKDAMEKNIIPQVCTSQVSPLLLYSLMADG
jgi:U4/U6.U5 tri-snRNP-associated protein 2